MIDIHSHTAGRGCGRTTFDPHLIGSRIAELRSLPERLPRIHRGCDFHLSASNIEDALQNPAKYTINGHRYGLVEFPDMFISPATEQILLLLAGRGMTPVITHPERDPVLHRDIARLSRWAAQGYLLQVTALSLRYGWPAGRSSRASWPDFATGPWNCWRSRPTIRTGSRSPRLPRSRTRCALTSEWGPCSAA
jgi:protein-tyrosine phosphatase